MKVFKFGGASIKDANAVRNMSDIVASYKGESLVVIVSAMGKSTNELEAIWKARISDQDYSVLVSEFEKKHINIAQGLFTDFTKIKKDISTWIDELKQIIVNAPSDNNQLYDSVVSIGELLSSAIIASFLNNQGITTQWADARELVRTSSHHREALVDWKVTSEHINQYVSETNGAIILSQGFIGGSKQDTPTTLGREGSDFTGAIFATCLDAESFTVWKDVPGILNADPRRIADVTLFDHLSYNEASEMTYYGAKVIHPKTIKPLANKNIPLYVRCFDDPDAAGTEISINESANNTPVIIFKEDQCLLSFKAKDLAFVNEEGISIIFDALHELNINAHMMQNSAVSFSMCVDYNSEKIEKLKVKLDEWFEVRYNSDLQLITIKNYTLEALDKYLPKGEILLEQKSRSNYRVLMGS